MDTKRHLEMETNPIVSDRDGSGTETETVMGGIVKEIFIEAPPNIVRDFLTDPKKLARWIRVLSGQKRLKNRKRGKKDHVIRHGQVQRVLNSRVVFRWEVYAMGISVSSVIEIDLEKRGNGTWVRLTHKEFKKELREAS